MNTHSTIRPKPSGTRTALIVEEDLDILHALAEIASDCGFHVSIAMRGDDALALIRLLAFDVVVLEPRVCTHDGIAVVACLRGQPNTARAAIIAVTTLRGHSVEKSLRGLGCDEVVFKPCDSHQIIDALVRYAAADETGDVQRRRVRSS